MQINNRERKAIISNKTTKAAQQSSIAEQKGNDNHRPTNKQIAVAQHKANHYRTTKGKHITIAKHKANHYRMTVDKQIITTKCKANGNRETNEATITNRNKKRTRISEQTVFRGKDS